MGFAAQFLVKIIVYVFMKFEIKLKIKLQFVKKFFYIGRGMNEQDVSIIFDVWIKNWIER